MTAKETGKTVRDRVRRLLVGVSPDERAAIQARAAAAGLSVAAYLRIAGLNHLLRSVYDRDAVEALARLHGELAQTRRLLEAILHFDQDPRIPALIAQIGQLRDRLSAQVERLG